MNIYYISGLGADHRAFSKLDFVQQYDAAYIEWLPVMQKKENIADYAKRMAEYVTGDDPILIGLSFGGMVAMEIAKLKSVKEVILISSCKTKNELPPQIKMAGALGLDSLLPTSLIKNSKPLVYNFLGTKTTEEKKIAEDFIDNIDEDYLNWSMRAISRWKNVEIKAPTFHIHGDSDMLLQSNFVEADAIVKGGNHFMIFNQAEEVNKILNKELQRLEQ